MDWDLLLRIGKLHPLHYVPTAIGCIREHQAAKTFAGGHARSMEIMRMLREHTGQWVPSGWIPYAAETYSRQWRAFVASLPLGPLDLPLISLPTAAMDFLVRRFAGRQQGIYESGWAGRRVKWLLPPGDGFLEIDGEMPANGWLTGQILHVWCDERYLGGHPLPTGQFYLRLPFGKRPAELANVRMVASHAFVPTDLEPSPEWREYSYRLKSIGWSSWRDSAAAC
jgi:hypothetical protein